MPLAPLFVDSLKEAFNNVRKIYKAILKSKINLISIFNTFSTFLISHPIISNYHGESLTTTTWVSSKIFHVRKTVTTVTRDRLPPLAPRGPVTPPSPAPSSSDTPGSPRGSQEASGDGDSGTGYPDNNVSERSQPSDTSSLLETTSSEGEISRGNLPRQDDLATFPDGEGDLDFVKETKASLLSNKQRGFENGENVKDVIM